MDVSEHASRVSTPERIADIWHVVRERDVSTAAAGVAYYAFNTLLPLLVLAVLAVSLSEYSAAAVDVFGELGGIEPANLRVVATSVQESEGVGRLAALAVVVATWSTLQMGRAIAGVFATIYGEADHSRLGRVADVVLVFLTWVVALALVVVLGIVVAYVTPGENGVGALWPLLLFAGLLVAFVPMYLVFPEDVTLLESLPGATLAAAAWTVSGGVFRVYARSATSVEFYGVVGVLLLLLTWLYLGSYALLAGAATNAVLADRVREP